MSELYSETAQRASVVSVEGENISEAASDSIASTATQDTTPPPSALPPGWQYEDFVFDKAFARIEAIRDLVYFGLWVVPLGGDGEPCVDGWDENFVDEDEGVTKHFSDEEMNVGVILGEKSGGLTALRLGSDLAAAAAPFVTPPTNLRIRKGPGGERPIVPSGDSESAWTNEVFGPPIQTLPPIDATTLLYATGWGFTKGQPTSIDYIDPVDGQTLVEIKIGVAGKPTCIPVPPSVIDEVALEWDDRFPGCVADINSVPETHVPTLARSAKLVAMMVLLAKHWKPDNVEYINTAEIGFDGKKVALAIAGFLHHAGVPHGEAKRALIGLGELTGYRSAWWDNLVGGNQQGYGKPGLKPSLDIGLAFGWKISHQLNLWFEYDSNSDGPNETASSSAPSNSTSDSSWDNPDLSILEESRGDLPSFPIEALGSPKLRTWLHKAARGAGTNIDQVAVPLLGVASSLIGTARRVQASKSWTQPLTINTCVVGYSGGGKTPGHDVSKRLLGRIQSERDAEIDELRREHETRVEVAKALRAEWEARVKEAAKAGVSPPIKPPGADAPEAFVIPQMAVSNVTIERLPALLKARPAGLMLLIDELSGLFANLSRYSNGSDRSFWLEAWNGGAYPVERVGRSPIFVEHLLVGISGGIQPVNIAKSFGTDDDGMAMRFLYAWPTEPDYAELSDDIDEIDPVALAALTTLAKIGNVPILDRPAVLTLAYDARALFEKLRQWVHTEKKALTGREREYLSKVPAHVLRLVGTLAMLDFAFEGEGGYEPTSIDADTMQRAIDLVVDYFLPHGKAALHQISCADAHVNGRKVLKWARARGLTQVGPTQVRREALGRALDAAGVAKLLTGLARSGWLRKEEVLTGGRPQTRFEVNPLLFASGGEEAATTTTTEPPAKQSEPLF